MQDRIDRAEALFRSGYNCSQALVGAFADLYGMDFALALRVSASFGGGIGRMRETCGAACGMFLLAGLETGCTDPKDRTGKEANYLLVQRLAAEFRRRNGSCICGELLGVRGQAAEPLSPTPEARTEGYYKKRPCVQLVKEAAAIYADYLTCKDKGEPEPEPAEPK